MKYFYITIWCFLCVFSGPSFAIRHRYNIIKFGAFGDGKQMNTVFIQNAIDQCAEDGGGKVIIPPGKFLSGSLVLKSGVILYLEKDSELLGSNKKSDYLKNTAYALILASRQSDVAIEGQGIIDGQGNQLALDIEHLWHTGLLPNNKGKNRPDEQYRPGIISMEDCQGITTSGITITNASCWVQTYRRCNSIQIKHIKVISTCYWNNDGIDLVDCTNARILACDINSADDGICLKSEDSALLCENIHIENCRVRSSANAVKLGTASFGGFQNIRVDHIYVYDTYRSAVALECVDGGFIKNIDIQNIKAVNTGNAFFLRVGKRNAKKAAGIIDSVSFKNIDVQVPATKPDKGYANEGPLDNESYNLLPSSIVGLTSGKIDHVNFKNVVIHYEGGGNENTAFVSLYALQSIPERPANYPEFSMFGELPAWGVYIRHADNITFKNFVLHIDKPDYRPAIVADDVQYLGVRKLTIVAQKIAPPLVVLHRVKQKEFISTDFTMPYEQAMKIVQ